MHNHVAPASHSHFVQSLPPSNELFDAIQCYRRKREKVKLEHWHHQERLLYTYNDETCVEPVVASIITVTVASSVTSHGNSCHCFHNCRSDHQSTCTQGETCCSNQGTSTPPCYGGSIIHSFHKQEAASGDNYAIQYSEAHETGACEEWCPRACHSVSFHEHSIEAYLTNFTHTLAHTGRLRCSQMTVSSQEGS